MPGCAVEVEAAPAAGGWGQPARLGRPSDRRRQTVPTGHKSRGQEACRGTFLIRKRFPLIQWLQDTDVIRVFLGRNDNVTTYTYSGVVQFSF